MKIKISKKNRETIWFHYCIVRDDVFKQTGEPISFKEYIFILQKSIVCDSMVNAFRRGEHKPENN